jgi:hypothetical protein
MSEHEPIDPRKALAQAEEQLRQLEMEKARRQASVVALEPVLAAQKRLVREIRRLLPETTQPPASRPSPPPAPKTKYTAYRGKRPREGSTGAATLLMLEQAGSEGLDPDVLAKALIAKGFFEHSNDIRKSVLWEVYNLGRRGFPAELSPDGRARLVVEEA